MKKYIIILLAILLCGAAYAQTPITPGGTITKRLYTKKIVGIDTTGLFTYSGIVELDSALKFLADGSIMSRAPYTKAQVDSITDILEAIPTLAQVLVAGNTSTRGLFVDTVGVGMNMILTNDGSNFRITDINSPDQIYFDPSSSRIWFKPFGGGESYIQAQTTANSIWFLPDSSGTVALREDLPIVSTLDDSTLIFTNTDGIATSDSNFVWINQTKKAVRFGGSPYKMNIPFGTDIYSFGVLRDSGTTDKTAEFVDFGTNVLHFRGWNGSVAFPKPKLSGETFSSWGFQPAVSTSSGVRVVGSTGSMIWTMRENATDTSAGNQFAIGVTPKGKGDNNRLTKLLLLSERGVFLNQLDSLDRGLIEQQYSSTAFGARILGEKHRGTITSPTTIVTGDTVAQFGARGYTGSSYTRAGWAGWRSNGTIAASRVPSEFILTTSTDASPSVETQAMRITNQQNVGIGLPATTTVSGRLHVSNNDPNFTGIRMENLTSSGVTGGASIYGIQDDGTTMLSGERVLIVAGFGNRTGAYGTIGVAGQMNMYAAGTWTNSSTPGYITFATTPSGSTSPVEAFRVTETQTLMVGANNNIVGTANSSDATTGNVGEYQSHTIPSGSALTLNGTPTNIDSLTLTAGDWDITGMINYDMLGASTTDFQGGFSFTSATLGADTMTSKKPFLFTSVTAVYTDALPTVRISINTSTKIYLVAQCSYTGTVTGYGQIRARRTR